MTTDPRDVSERDTTPRRRDDEENERLDRELMELVNELRVALTGVQILFAFLLTCRSRSASRA